MKHFSKSPLVFLIPFVLIMLVFQSCKDKSNPVTPVTDTPYEIKVTYAPVEVKSTDGKINLLYSVEMPNFEKDGYQLKDFQVVNSSSGVVLSTISDTGKYLLIHKPVPDGVPVQLYSYPLDYHGTYRFTIDLVLDQSQVPQKIKHKVILLKDSKEKIMESAETVVTNGSITVISSPLKGDGFISMCTTNLIFNHHPTYQITYKGKTTVPERYCVDWLKVDSTGSLFHGDQTICENWYVYGQNIYAATSGQVAFVQDGLPDQSPVGTVNDVTIFTGTGNSVVITSGISYTVYGHMIPNTIQVRPGQSVQKGQLIGRVGNSGNSNAPHLHFGVHTDFPYYISEGLPYYIDSLEKKGALLNPTMVGGYFGVTSISGNSY